MMRWLGICAWLLLVGCGSSDICGVYDVETTRVVTDFLDEPVTKQATWELTRDGHGYIFQKLGADWVMTGHLEGDELDLVYVQTEQFFVNTIHAMLNTFDDKLAGVVTTEIVFGADQMEEVLWVTATKK